MDVRQTRRIVFDRSGGLCEVSGLPIEWESFDLHHRRNKGMGGTSRPDRDEPQNLLALDPQVHNGGPASVHGRRPWSERRGYLVPKHEDRPEDWPVWLHGRGWVLLTVGGRRLPIALPPPIDP